MQLMKLKTFRNHFCNFSNEQAGNVIESTRILNLKLETYLKEPASTDFMKTFTGIISILEH